MFEYYAEVLKIVDGDTIDVMVDLGMGVHRKEHLRFARINTQKPVGNIKKKASWQRLELPNLFLLVNNRKDRER